MTVDQNGHIYIWKYEKKALTSKQCFEPVGRFRVSLTYYKFARAGETKLFPADGKDIDPAKPIPQAKMQAILDYQAQGTGFDVV